MFYFTNTEKKKKDRHLTKHPKWVLRMFNRTHSIHDLYDSRLAPHVTVHNRLLDAGCGKKGILDRYRGRFGYAVGMDLSFAAIKQNTAAEAFVMGNLNAIPFANETFNIIISQWVLEHLYDPTHVFRECYRILKKEGIFIVVSNSIYHPLNFFCSLFPKKIRHRIKSSLLPVEIEEDTFPTYYRCNSLKSLNGVCLNIGFIPKFNAYIGDPSFFIFSRCFFPVFLFYEKITDLKPFKRFKMHIISEYTK